jgi:hypothetical protein
MTSKLYIFGVKMVCFIVPAKYLRIVPQPFAHIHGTRSFLSEKIDHLLRSRDQEPFIVLDRRRGQSTLPSLSTTDMILFIPGSNEV